MDIEQVAEQFHNIFQRVADDIPGHVPHLWSEANENYREAVVESFEWLIRQGFITIGQS